MSHKDRYRCHRIYVKLVRFKARTRYTFATFFQGDLSGNVKFQRRREILSESIQRQFVREPVWRTIKIGRTSEGHRWIDKNDVTAVIGSERDDYTLFNQYEATRFFFFYERNHMYRESNTTHVKSICFDRRCFIWSNFWNIEKIQRAKSIPPDWEETNSNKSLPTIYTVFALLKMIRSIRCLLQDYLTRRLNWAVGFVFKKTFMWKQRVLKLALQK